MFYGKLRKQSRGSVTKENGLHSDEKHITYGTTKKYAESAFLVGGSIQTSMSPLRPAVTTRKTITLFFSS
jgi:hypothetical protein